MQSQQRAEATKQLDVIWSHEFSRGQESVATVGQQNPPTVSNARRHPKKAHVSKAPKPAIRQKGREKAERQHK